MRKCNICIRHKLRFNPTILHRLLPTLSPMKILNLFESRFYFELLFVLVSGFCSVSHAFGPYKPCIPSRTHLVDFDEVFRSLDRRSFAIFLVTVHAPLVSATFMLFLRCLPSRVIKNTLFTSTSHPSLCVFYEISSIASHNRLLTRHQFYYHFFESA